MTNEEIDRQYVANVRRLIDRLRSDPIPFRLRLYRPDDGSVGDSKLPHPQPKVIIRQEDES